MQKELEFYLSELEKALSGISVGERAEIITEIKSHIMEAQEREPERSLNDILTSMGDPHQVASRYLMERGIQPVKNPNRFNQAAKWVTIGILGFVGMGCLMLIVLIKSFTPLIEVDEEKGRVEILGGTIKVDEDVAGDMLEGMEGLTLAGVHVGGQNYSPVEFKGTRELGKKELYIQFTNGKFDLETVHGSKLRYDCKVSAQGNQPKFEEKNNKVLLDLGETRGGKCALGIPKGASVKIEGHNGKMDLEEPLFHAEVKIINGKVDIEPARHQEYNFETRLSNGVADSFETSSAKDAWQIKIAVVNGAIKRD